MEILRTPDERFGDLPDFPWAPRYVDVPSGDGGTLRMAWVEAGPTDGEVVLLLHGEPTWSFLYRKVMRVVSDFGLRAIAPDLVGFGRSDKPARREDYTYERHRDWVVAFLDALALRDLTLVCQDWGGLLGLRIVGEQPHRFRRVIATNTGLPTGDQKPSSAFFAWQQLSQSLPVFPTSNIVQGGCAKALSEAVLAAYDAPFPDERHKAGARQFPLLVPTSPDDPATPALRKAWEGLATFDRPFLCAFSDGDPITRGADRPMREKIPGARAIEHRTIRGAGHFVQEDAGEELGDAVVELVRATR